MEYLSMGGANKGLVGVMPLNSIDISVLPLKAHRQLYASSPSLCIKL